MPTFKQVVWTVVIAALTSTVLAIVGFLSAARLEISFDKLRDFDAANLKSYKALGTSVKFDFQLSEPREFIAFWGENENGKTIPHRSDVHFKNFKLTSSIEGDVTHHMNGRDVVFNIVGYYNSNRIVFSHRGPISGVGVYILDLIQVLNVAGEVFAGYAIFEDVKTEGKNDVWLTQCPFVMLDQAAAAKPYATVDDAQKAFPLLNAECIEFKMPDSS